MESFQPYARYVVDLLAREGGLPKAAIKQHLEREFRILSATAARAFLELEISGVLMRSEAGDCYQVRPGYIYTGHEPSYPWSWPSAG